MDFIISILFFGGITTFILVVLARKLMVRSLLTVTARVNPDPAGLGQKIRVEVLITPKKSFQFTALTVALEAREKVTAGSGTNSTTYTKTVVSAKHECPLPGLLQAGVPWPINAPFTIPPDSMCTVTMNDNLFEWLVRVEGAIPNWPDFKKEYYFTVKPEIVGT